MERVDFNADDQKETHIYNDRVGESFQKIVTFKSLKSTPNDLTVLFTEI